MPVALGKDIGALLAVAAFLIVLAVLAILRVVSRDKGGPRWHMIRFGVFLEREDQADDASTLDRDPTERTSRDRADDPRT